MLTLAIPTIGSTTDDFLKEALLSAISSPKDIVTEILISDDSRSDIFRNKLIGYQKQESRIKIKLFGKISKLIYKLIQGYYSELSGRTITTGMVIAYQSFGDQIRFNPHFHTIVLEGGFDSNNNFYFLPVKNMEKLTEAFRYKAIKFFEENSLINNSFANNLRSWVHSGFSVDNSISLYTHLDKDREKVCQYIFRAPVSLKKIGYVPDKGTVSLHTKYNQYFGENINLWKATDFIAALTAHLPQKKIHLVRYYGLYSSRTKGKRDKKADEEKAQEKLTTQNNNLDMKNILN